VQSYERRRRLDWTREQRAFGERKVRLKNPAWMILSKPLKGQAENVCTYNDLGGLHILVLFEDSDGSMLTEDGVLGEEDFFNLFL
jgi:hypothetical protein